MNYESICRYVFVNEGISWDMSDSKKRDTELVIARQISIYLGNLFFPELTWASLAEMFGKDHATAIYAVKTIRNLMDSDRRFRRRVTNYIAFIREMKSGKGINTKHTMNLMISTLDKMKLIAEVYCELTNNKMVAIN